MKLLQADKTVQGRLHKVTNKPMKRGSAGENLFKYCTYSRVQVLYFISRVIYYYVTFLSSTLVQAVVTN